MTKQIYQVLLTHGYLADSDFESYSCGNTHLIADSRIVYSKEAYQALEEVNRNNAVFMYDQIQALKKENARLQELAMTAEKWRGIASAKYGDGCTVSQIQEEATEELRAVLEIAKNGLQWYMDTYPDSVSDCDYETLKRIDVALEGGAI